MIGDAENAADHVGSQGYRVKGSDVDLLGDLDRIVDLDAEVAHRALDLRMSEQKLDRTEIARSSVDQHSLRVSERVRSELRRIEADAPNPFLHEARILPRRQTSVVTATGEQELPSQSTGEAQVLVNRLARLVSQLEPSWATGLW